jgi:branched-chain amino acid transport system permease protein
MDLKPFIVSGLAMGGVYALSGVGLTVLYRTTGVVNFAYGAMGAIGALVGWDLIQRGTAQPVAWAAAIAVAIAVSLAYGLLFAPRLALRNQTTNAAATLGLALVLLGLTQLLWRDEARSFDLPSDDLSFVVFGVRVVATQAIALGAAVVLTALVGVLLVRTRSGLSLRAMAQDRELSGMLGIQALCGALSGISGLLVADLVRLEAGTLTLLVVPGIAAAIIGRLDSLPLVCAGGLAIGVLEGLGTPYEAISNYRSIVPLLLASVILLLRHGSGGATVAAAR